MNKITAWFSSRLALTLVMVMSMAYAAAQNVLTIDPVTITSNAGVTVPVNLSSTTDLSILIFDVTLPEGITVEGLPEVASDRIDLEEGESVSDLFNVQINRNPDNKGANVWRIGMFPNESFSKIVAGEGELMSLDFAITEDAFLAGGTFTGTISAEKTDGVEGSEFEITVASPTEGVAVVTAPETVEVTSGVKAPVAINLENNLPVAALKFDIVLPEALTLAKNGRRYDFSYGPRWAEGNSVNVTEKENGVRVIITNVSTNVIAAAGEGELFSFYVIADDVHSKAEIKVTGINATMKFGGENVDLYSPDQTIIAVNEDLMQTMIDQIEEDEALINELATSFQQFNTLVDEEFPGYANLKADEIAAVNAMIEALNEKFIEAQSQADQTGIYEGIPQEDLTAATEALLALVTGEAEARQAIDNAFQEDYEKLAELAAKVDPVVEDLDGKYSDEIVAQAEVAYADVIAALNACQEAQYKAINETGVYESPIDEAALAELTAEVEDVRTAINNALLALIEEDQELLNERETAFQEFLNETAENFPGYLVLKAEEIAAVTAKIEALNDMFIQAQEAAAETDVYEGLPAQELTELTNMILALITGEEETIAAITSEYEQDVENLNEIVTALQEFNTQVAEEFPGYAVLKAEEIAALTAKVEELNDQINAALENALATGVYEGPSQEDLMAATDALLALVTGEEETIAAITSEYDQDVENLNEITTALQEFNTQVAENFPGYAVLKAEEIAALTAQVEELNNQINAALETAFETGVYEGPSQEDMMAATNALLALVTGEEETIAAIQSEYDQDVENLNEITTALQEFNTQVAEEFPGYAVLKAEEIAALTAQVEELNNQINAALETAFETGVYEGPSQEDLMAATDALLGLVTGLEEVANAIQGEYEQDIENLNTLTTGLQEFNNEVAENFPGYAVLHADEIAAVTAQIEALNNQITAALETAFETGVYEGPSQEDMMAATDALMALVTGEEEAIAAIQSEYDQDVENVNELATALQEFNNQVAEEFPGYAVLKAEEIAELTAMVEALYNQTAAGLEAAFETGVYEGPSQEDLMAATDALIALVTGEEETIAAITAASEEDVEAVNEIANALQELNNMIASEFPGFANLEAEEIAAATAMVEALNNQVTAGLEAAFETGEYAGPSQADIVAATEAVMQLSADADAALAAINAAAEEDYDVLSDLNEAMAGILDDETEFPAFIFAYGDEVGAAAEALRGLFDQVEAAIATAIGETGVYESPSQEDFTNTKDLVMSLVATRNEALAAIENAAMADYEKLAELAAQLEPIIEDEEGRYSEEVVAQAEAVYAEILEQLDAVFVAQYDALFETAEYVSPLDEETLANIAAEIEEIIKTSSINSVLNANDGALYFDLNGLKVNEPKAGNVYIKVENGHATKYVHK